MKNVTKIGLTLVALGVVGLSMNDARAGNLSAPNAEYYSVEMLPGQYLSHSSSEAVVLVDDITYSCDYAPCDPEVACLFFDSGDLPTNALEGLSTPGGQFPGMHPPPPMAGLFYARDTSHAGGAGWQRTSSVQASKRKFQEVGMFDSSNGTSGAFFDRFSFCTYGQMFYVSEREWSWYEDWLFEAWYAPYSTGVGVGDGGAGGVGIGRGVALSTTLYSVPSSGSRHYQSPHILQNGRAYFVVAAGGTSITGTVDVKGRVILSPNPVPTSSTGISITGP